MVEETEHRYNALLTTPKLKSNKIVIDNGTYELKAGYMNECSIITKNTIFKTRHKSSFSAFPSSTKYTMFNYDIIVNLEIFGYMLDNVLEYLKPEYKEIDNGCSDLHLYLTVPPQSPTTDSLIKYVFDNYKLNKITLCYGFIYSYHKYYKSEDCLIINISHSSTIFCYIKDDKIEHLQRLNFGGIDLQRYIKRWMHFKYQKTKLEYDELIYHLRVPMDYKKESIEIFNEMCQGNYSRNVILSDEYAYLQEEDNREKGEKEDKVSKNENLSNFRKRKLPEISDEIVEGDGEEGDSYGDDDDEDGYEGEESTISSKPEVPEIDYDLIQKPDDDLSPEEIKSKRRFKLIFYSTQARFKTKTIKLLENLRMSIDIIKDKIERNKDIKLYISKRKEKFELMKRELKDRSNLRNCLKDRSGREIVIKNKNDGLTNEEIEIKNKIIEAEDGELEKELNKKLIEESKIIKELDPNFIPFYASTVEIIKGDNIGRDCVNIELIKWAEILFDPSILKINEMGITETLSFLSEKFNIKNVLITGGLSNIKNIKERISYELNRRSVTNEEINVKVVENSQTDSFYSVCDSVHSLSINRKDWELNEEYKCNY